MVKRREHSSPAGGPGASPSEPTSSRTRRNSQRVADAAATGLEAASGAMKPPPPLPPPPSVSSESPAEPPSASPAGKRASPRGDAVDPPATRPRRSTRRSLTEESPSNEGAENPEPNAQSTRRSLARECSANEGAKNFDPKAQNTHGSLNVTSVLAANPASAQKRIAGRRAATGRDAHSAAIFLAAATEEDSCDADAPFAGFDAACAGSDATPMLCRFVTGLELRLAASGLSVVGGEGVTMRKRARELESSGKKSNEGRMKKEEGGRQTPKRTSRDFNAEKSERTSLRTRSIRQNSVEAQKKEEQGIVAKDDSKTEKKAPSSTQSKETSKSLEKSRKVTDLPTNRGDHISQASQALQSFPRTAADHASSELASVDKAAPQSSPLRPTRSCSKAAPTQPLPKPSRQTRAASGTGETRRFSKKGAENSGAKAQNTRRSLAQELPSNKDAENPDVKARSPVNPASADQLKVGTESSAAVTDIGSQEILQCATNASSSNIRHQKAAGKSTSQKKQPGAPCVVDRGDESLQEGDADRTHPEPKQENADTVGKQITLNSKNLLPKNQRETGANTRSKDRQEASDDYRQKEKGELWSISSQKDYDKPMGSSREKDGQDSAEIPEHQNSRKKQSGTALKNQSNSSGNISHKSYQDSKDDVQSKNNHRPSEGISDPKNRGTSSKYSCSSHKNEDSSYKEEKSSTNSSRHEERQESSEVDAGLSNKREPSKDKLSLKDRSGSSSKDRMIQEDRSEPKDSVKHKDRGDPSKDGSKHIDRRESPKDAPRQKDLESSANSSRQKDRCETPKESSRHKDRGESLRDGSKHQDRGESSKDGSRHRDRGESSSDSSRHKDRGESSKDDSRHRDRGESSRDSSVHKDQGVPSKDASRHRDRNESSRDRSRYKDRGEPSKDASRHRDRGKSSSDSSRHKDRGKSSKDDSRHRDRGETSKDDSKNGNRDKSSKSSSRHRDRGESSKDSSRHKDRGESSKDDSRHREHGESSKDRSRHKERGGSSKDDSRYRDRGESLNESLRAKDRGESSKDGPRDKDREKSSSDSSKYRDRNEASRDSDSSKHKNRRDSSRDRSKHWRSSSKDRSKHHDRYESSKSGSRLKDMMDSSRESSKHKERRESSKDKSHRSDQREPPKHSSEKKIRPDSSRDRSRQDGKYLVEESLVQRADLLKKNTNDEKGLVPAKDDARARSVKGFSQDSSRAMDRRETTDKTKSSSATITKTNIGVKTEKRAVLPTKKSTSVPPPPPGPAGDGLMRACTDSRPPPPGADDSACSSPSLPSRASDSSDRVTSLQSVSASIATAAASVVGSGGVKTSADPSRRQRTFRRARRRSAVTQPPSVKLPATSTQAACSASAPSVPGPSGDASYAGTSSDDDEGPFLGWTPVGDGFRPVSKKLSRPRKSLGSVKGVSRTAVVPSNAQPIVVVTRLPDAWVREAAPITRDVEQDEEDTLSLELDTSAADVSIDSVEPATLEGTADPRPAEKLLLKPTKDDADQSVKSPLIEDIADQDVSIRPSSSDGMQPTYDDGNAVFSSEISSPVRDRRSLSAASPKQVVDQDSEDDTTRDSCAGKLETTAVPDNAARRDELDISSERVYEELERSVTSSASGRGRDVAGFSGEQRTRDVDLASVPLPGEAPTADESDTKSRPEPERREASGDGYATDASIRRQVSGERDAEREQSPSRIQPSKGGPDLNDNVEKEPRSEVFPDSDQEVGEEPAEEPDSLSVSDYPGRRLESAQCDSDSDSEHFEAVSAAVDAELESSSERQQESDTVGFSSDLRLKEEPPQQSAAEETSSFHGDRLRELVTDERSKSGSAYDPEHPTAGTDESQSSLISEKPAATIESATGKPPSSFQISDDSRSALAPSRPTSKRDSATTETLPEVQAVPPSVGRSVMKGPSTEQESASPERGNLGAESDSEVGSDSPLPKPESPAVCGSPRSEVVERVESKTKTPFAATEPEREGGSHARPTREEPGTAAALCKEPEAASKPKPAEEEPETAKKEAETTERKPETADEEPEEATVSAPTTSKTPQSENVKRGTAGADSNYPDESQTQPTASRASDWPRPATSVSTPAARPPSAGAADSRSPAQAAKPGAAETRGEQRPAEKPGQKRHPPDYVTSPERKRSAAEAGMSTLAKVLNQKFANSRIHANKIGEKLRNYQVITDNIWLAPKPRETKQQKETRRMACACSLTPEEVERGEWGCGAQCLNRLLMVECGARCPVGDRCGNKRFTRRRYCRTEVFRTDMKGYGLRALQDMPVGAFIYEYVGEVLDMREFRRRRKEYARLKYNHQYFMALHGETIVDATEKGNDSRFINHSCEPNSETQKWTVNGELRIGFFTKRAVSAGEEITFDYQLRRYGRKAQRCYCGSAQCRGWIGRKPDDHTPDSEDDDDPDEEDTGAGRPGTQRRAEKARQALKARDAARRELGVEISRLASSGLKSRQHTLELSRLMVRAESDADRCSLLQLLRTADRPCRRLFLDYHGLRLIWTWMARGPPAAGDGDSHKLRKEILQTLSVLPITDRTALRESRVLTAVERWAQSSRPSTPPTPDTDPPSDHTPPETGHLAEAEAAEISKRAKTLLSSWNSLKNVFRIPKKERLQQMREHEQEADRGYQTYLQQQTRASSQYAKRGYGCSPERRKRSRESPDPAAERRAKKYRAFTDSGLTKEERRKLFTLEVQQREEQERRRREQTRHWLQAHASSSGSGPAPEKEPEPDPDQERRRREQERRRREEERRREQERRKLMARSSDSGPVPEKEPEKKKPELVREKESVPEKEPVPVPVPVPEPEPEPEPVSGSVQREQQEELWSGHEQRCNMLGLDPYLTPIFDASFQYYWEPSTGAWQQYAPGDPAVPLVAAPGADPALMAALPHHLAVFQSMAAVDLQRAQQYLSRVARGQNSTTAATTSTAARPQPTPAAQRPPSPPASRRPPSPPSPPAERRLPSPPAGYRTRSPPTTRRPPSPPSPSLSPEAYRPPSPPSPTSSPEVRRPPSAARRPPSPPSERRPASPAPRQRRPPSPAPRQRRPPSPASRQRRPSSPAPRQRRPSLVMADQLPQMGLMDLLRAQIAGRFVPDGDAASVSDQPGGVASIPLPEESRRRRDAVPAEARRPRSPPPPQQQREPARPPPQQQREPARPPPPPEPEAEPSVRLPPKWRMATDDTGKPYYYHQVTLETRWEPPDNPDSTVADPVPTGSPTYSPTSDSSDSDSSSESSSESSSSSETSSDSESSDDEETASRRRISSGSGSSATKKPSRRRAPRTPSPVLPEAPPPPRLTAPEDELEEGEIPDITATQKMLSRWNRRHGRRRTDPVLERPPSPARAGKSRSEARRQRRQKRADARRERRRDRECERLLRKHRRLQQETTIGDMSPGVEARHIREEAIRRFKAKEEALLQEQEDAVRERHRAEVEAEEMAAAKRRKLEAKRSSSAGEGSSLTPKGAKVKPTTAAADTSSEMAKKIKDKFLVHMSAVVVSVLNSFRKPTCKQGRITSIEDFKLLAKRLTHHVLVKELRSVKNVEDLVPSDPVKHKARYYVRKYMSRFGELYEQPAAAGEPGGPEEPGPASEPMDL